MSLKEVKGDHYTKEKNAQTGPFGTDRRHCHFRGS